MQVSICLLRPNSVQQAALGKGPSVQFPYGSSLWAPLRAVEPVP